MLDQAGFRVNRLSYNPNLGRGLCLGIVLVLTFSLFSPLLSALPEENPLKGDLEHSLGYVIITTEEILHKSKTIGDFKKYLESRGFDVYIITEKDYGYEQGQKRALNIRSWLKENFEKLNIVYVLLIGNPDPDDPTDPNDSYGDVPMFMAWPYKIKGGVPTDFFYADLTGSCDLDNDGLLGESPDDIGEGGLDLKAEVYVGRIPVYNNNIDALDEILQRIMNRKDSPKKILLSLSIMNYDMEDYFLWERTDGSYFPSYLGKELGKDWNITGLYEAEGLEPSDRLAYFTKALNTENLVDEWNRGYGIVFWFSHGNSHGIFRKIWKYDDGDGVPESSEIEYVPYLNVSIVETKLKPMQTFVFGLSCFGGMPEDPKNLQYSLLRYSALGVVGATRDAWYFYGTWVPDGDASAIEIGYRFLLLMSKGYTSGIALYKAKSEVSTRDNAFWLANIYTFNLYGDPSQGIYKDSLTVLIRVPQDFSSINEALSNAMPGALIVVDNGTYYESVEISGDKLKQVKIMSKYGPEGSKIIAKNPQFVVGIFDTEGVVVSGFKLIGYRSFLISHSNNVVIEENTIVGTDEISFVYRSKNVILRDNMIIGKEGFSQYSMMLLAESYHVKILDNTLEHVIINMSKTYGNVICNNTLLDSGLILSSTANNVIERNVVDGLPLKYVENATNIIISGTYGEIIVVNSENIFLKNLRVNGAVGLSISEASSISIISANISEAYIGVFFQNSRGIKVLDSYMKNSYTALYASNVLGAEILKNVFENNTRALYLLDSKNLWIYLNNFIENKDNAILVNTSCTFESPKEIVYYVGSSKITSYVGNFWSGFSAEDNNADAILDVQYAVTENCFDKHPLKYRFEFYLNKPPVANFDYYPKNISIFDKIIINATPSYDPDGEIVKYEWYIDGKHVSNNIIVTNRFILPGEHTIELVVYDNYGAISKCYITVSVCVSAYDAVVLVGVFAASVISLLKIFVHSIKKRKS